MGKGYYRSINTKKLIALLIRQGFINSAGTKHGKYVHENSSNVIIVPRHRSLSPGTSKQICEELEKTFKVPSDELKKLF
jgi:predicted RNA binding protein YcfA (HicA-like mRNA interferase family)